MSETAVVTGDKDVTSRSLLSVKPVVLPAPERGTDLQVRITAPASGERLPVLVFSHGFGWSMDGYGPLVDHWAAQGFVVVQPTHLDSRSLGLPPDDPRAPRFWRLRVEDLTRCLDALEALAAAVPGLAGRLDPSRIAVAGHSWGGQTASMLLGARVLDAAGRAGEELTDPRVRAGVLLAVPGRGGADLAPWAAEQMPFMHPEFAGMRTPTLVVAGDRDDSPLSVRGPDWFTDSYTASPGPKSLLTVFGGEHSLGGIAGHEVAETTDESPERRALVREFTTAYLHSALEPARTDWAVADAALAARAAPAGRVDSK